MGVVTRKGSPYYWANIPRQGRRTPHRLSLKIPIDAPTAEQRKENKRLAETAYNVMLGDLARKRFDLPSTDAMPLFGAYADWYETHHTSKHEGALQEKRKLTRLRQFFARYPLDAITPSRWTEYETERLNEGVSISTVGRELAVMKALLTTSVGGVLKFNPLATVKRKRKKLKAKRTVTVQEESALLRALGKIDDEIHDLYLVGVGTLLRRETLLELQRSEHRGDRLVVDTKTGPHQVPLNGPTPLQRRAAAVLERRMPTKSAGYFFPRWQKVFAAYEDPGHPGVLFLKKVRRAAKAAGLPWGLSHDGIVWHTATRATGATRMLREFGVDVRTVQFIGGWTSLDQMAEYLGIDRESLFR